MRADPRRGRGRGGQEEGRIRTPKRLVLNCGESSSLCRRISLCDGCVCRRMSRGHALGSPPNNYFHLGILFSSHRIISLSLPASYAHPARTQLRPNLLWLLGVSTTRTGSVEGDAVSTIDRTVGWGYSLTD